MTSTSISEDHISILAECPSRLTQLSPAEFELLIADRLSEMGLRIQQVGATNRKDGGIGILACPMSGMPFLLAVQVKHHRSSRKTGVSEIRDFAGVLHTHREISMGLVVTNTAFSPDAQWFAEQQSALLQLDAHDLTRWLKRDFDNPYEWREMPDSITLAPNIVIQIPRPSIWVPS